MGKIKNIFFSLIAVFILLVLYFFIPFSHEVKRLLFPVVAVVGFVFLLLGAYLVFLVRKHRVKNPLRTYLILVGIAPVVSFVSVILHNVIYGLFIFLFGEWFWGNGDEAFFFILGLVVFPVLFLVGVVGSLVKGFRKI